MDKISAEEFPKKLTNKVIDILAKMLGEAPVSQEWIEINKKLTDDQKFIIHERLSQLRKEREKTRIESMTKEDQLKEKKKREEFFENADPHKFYGNMGQPETPQEFKNRYGVWPPGYDEHGNKIVKD
ncbi:MAG: hypothetical protein HC880_06705 [Bacteroidia bacterium]|nr:hypothetical protein [Bacteroidia bacterium]